MGKRTTGGGACPLLPVFLCMCGCIYPGLHADMTLSIYSQVKPETRVEANKASMCSRSRRVFDMWCYEQNKHRASPPVWVCYLSSSESDTNSGDDWGTGSVHRPTSNSQGYRAMKKHFGDSLQSDRTPESPGTVTERPDRKSEQICTVPGTYTSTEGMIQPTVKQDTPKETHTL